MNALPRDAFPHFQSARVDDGEEEEEEDDDEVTWDTSSSVSRAMARCAMPVVCDEDAFASTMAAVSRGSTSPPRPSPASSSELDGSSTWAVPPRDHQEDATSLAHSAGDSRRTPVRSAWLSSFLSPGRSAPSTPVTRRTSPSPLKRLVIDDSGDQHRASPPPALASLKRKRRAHPETSSVDAQIHQPLHPSTHVQTPTTADDVEEDPFAFLDRDVEYIRNMGKENAPPDTIVDDEDGDREVGGGCNVHHGEERDIEPSTPSWKSFLVLDVALGECCTSVSAMHVEKRPEKICRLLDEQLEVEAHVHLRDEWLDTPVEAGDHLNVLGVFRGDHPQTCVVDSTHHLVVLNPELLLSGTSVGSSFACLRRAVLNERLRSSGEIAAPMVQGDALHQLFDYALRTHDFSDDGLRRVARQLAEGKEEELYALNTAVDVFVSQLEAFIERIQRWGRNFLRPRTSEAHCTTQINHRDTEENDATPPIRFDGPHSRKVVIRKVLAIEENIWAPWYGLKGKIDASVEVDVDRGACVETLAVPLELKTGKERPEQHRAQVILYTLLMQERYGVPIRAGLLYYMSSVHMEGVQVVRKELVSIVGARNRLAAYLRRPRRTGHHLPPMKKSVWECRYCPQLQACMVLHKALEQGSQESAGVGTLFNEATEHLKRLHQDYFTKWLRMLDLEAEEQFKHQEGIWTLSGEEREKQGLCFARMKITREERGVGTGTGAIGHAYVYTFQRVHGVGGRSDPSGSAARPHHFHRGDYIVVSTESHVAIATGKVVRVTRETLVVRLEDRLRAPPVRQSHSGTGDHRNHGGHAVASQRFPGLSDVEDAIGGVPPSTLKGCVWRVDKAEMAAGLTTTRGNLVHLMRDTRGASRIRGLVMDLNRPKFNQVRYEEEERNESTRSLNPAQKDAVEKVLCAQDYALILGMPGTGKTTTIAHVVASLYRMGRSVIVTAYTHTAVDNVLLRLKTLGVDEFARLGRRDAVHPTLQGHIPRGDGKVTLDDLSECPIVGVTCLGIKHPIFQKRTFDYCIVDEASQLTQPVCLGPIRHANVFVLVGDHYQLPPLVRSSEARELGMGISLFKKLSEAHPHAVANLVYQYRMCKEVMMLANTLVYSNRLRCGTEDVANRRIVLNGYRTASHHTCINKTLNPDQPVVFLNTDAIPCREDGSGNVNEGEAKLTYTIVKALLDGGCSPEEIGIISPYRAQLKAIQNDVDRLDGGDSIETHTVDKYQGRDKEAIVVSLVRSSVIGTLGDLLRDWRRVNVAFTRAKSKLIIIGSMSTLKKHEPFHSLLDLLQNKSWVINAHKNVLEEEEGGTLMKG